MTPIVGNLSMNRVRRELESLHFETDQLLSGLERINGGILTVVAELDRFNRILAGPIRQQLAELTRVVRRLQDPEDVQPRT